MQISKETIKTSNALITRKRAVGFLTCAISEDRYTYSFIVICLHHYGSDQNRCSISFQEIQGRQPHIQLSQFVSTHQICQGSICWSKMCHGTWGDTQCATGLPSCALQEEIKIKMRQKILEGLQRQLIHRINNVQTLLLLAFMP